MLFEFRRDSDLGFLGVSGTPVGLQVSGVPETYKRETASQGEGRKDVDGGWCWIVIEVVSNRIAIGLQFSCRRLIYRIAPSEL